MQNLNKQDEGIVTISGTHKLETNPHFDISKSYSSSFHLNVNVNGHCVNGHCVNGHCPNLYHSASWVF